MKTIVVIILVVASASACQRYRPLTPSDTYIYGLNRGELHKRIGEPDLAWSKTEGATEPDADILEYIKLAEILTQVEVSTCDVYSVARTSTFGLYRDYIAYNKNSEIVHFKRRFLD